MGRDLDDLPPLAWVVIGPSGSGKSTLGAALAARLGAPFIEADGLHPPSNIAKMSAGQSLDDADRAPWLSAVAAAIASARRDSRQVVAACSALKRTYRDQLVREGSGPMVFVYAEIDRAGLAARMTSRPGHFMPASLLNRQLETFEPPQADERAITLPAELDPSAQVEACLPAAFVNPSTWSREPERVWGK